MSTQTWKFDHWVLDGTTGSNLEAIFTQVNPPPEPIPQYTLTINIIGIGTVTPSQGTYDSGSNVQLIATAPEGWTFTDWSGDIVSSSNPSTIIMNSNKVVSAIFTQNIYTIIVSIVPSDGGIVTRNNNGPYHLNDVVVLTESSNSGYTFSGWSGGGTGSGSTRTVTVTGNMAVTATFALIPPPTPTYTLATSIVGQGTIAKNPDQSTYVSGSNVQLVATPITGWSFSSWSGDISGTNNPVSITINGNKNIVATFTQIPPPSPPSGSYTYTISMSGTNILAQNSSGTTVSSGTDLGKVFNILNGILATNDTILFKNYIYPLSSPMLLTKMNITLDAESGSTISAQSAIGQQVLFRIQGSYNTIKNIIFDDNYRGGVVASVFLMGSYNTIRECTLINCDRYGFATWIADHFQILNNHIIKAQYGISGADNGTSSIWSTNGLVEGNIIGDCHQAGIKMKMWKDTIVQKNKIDVGYKQYGHTGYNNGQWGSAPASDGMVGIWYYHLDTPTQNVTTQLNTITDTTKTSQKGIGLIVDRDSPGDWPGCPYKAIGMKILNNVFTVPFYGIIIQGNTVEADYNDCTIGGIRVDSSANNTILKGNLGRIQNNGSGTVIS